MMYMEMAVSHLRGFSGNTIKAKGYMPAVLGSASPVSSFWEGKECGKLLKINYSRAYEELCYTLGN